MRARVFVLKRKQTKYITTKTHTHIKNRVTENRKQPAKMHTFSENSSGVPAFLAKLWRLVEDEETNNLIYWSAVSVAFCRTYTKHMTNSSLYFHMKN